MKLKTAFFIIFTALFICCDFDQAALPGEALVTLKLSAQGLVS
jgi:hypothetical protein